jgi:pimeloyl-ACP methyl ester carboxylesterase
VRLVFAVRRIGAVSLLLALAVVVAACAGGGTPNPPASPVPVGAGCLTSGERIGAVRFHSRSGAELAGVVLGSGRAGVVMAHGPHGNVCEVMPYARVLVGLGYRVMAFDFNGYGASGAGTDFPAKGHLDLDVAAATATLRARGVDRVVLLGSEFGGLGSLIAAADVRPPVAGVVDLSGPNELAGMDGLAAAARLAVPSLFVVSARDPFVDVIRATYAAVTAPDRHLEVTPADGMHALNMVDPGRDPYAAHVRAVVEDFIHRHTAD